jgi:hypothetical protein
MTPGTSVRYRLLCFILLFAVLSSAGWAGTSDQYVVLNIIPGEAYGPIFQQVQQITPEVGPGQPRLGLGAIFSYLDQSPEECRTALLEFLSLSERYEIPVVVQLDGEQWWRARPDLWNWWDPAQPGFDIANRENVEWTGWGPECAMKIAWRNWGRQLRVLPPPNFMSQRYRDACHAEMRRLIPLVLRWWKDLPEEKQYLLIGIKLGWESAIGVNSFYIPGGNALLDLPEEKDPQITLKGERVPDRGVTAIGYAAVTTAHLASGGALREDHLAEIVSRHLEDLCALAAELGVPRVKLFTHVGGWKEEELLYDAALNSYSCPGWSFYRHAADPGKDRGVARVLGKSDAPYWGAVEWLLEGKHDKGAWVDALSRTLSIPKCRYVCIYNWSGIRDDQAALEGIREILATRSDGIRQP